MLNATTTYLNQPPQQIPATAMPGTTSQAVHGASGQIYPVLPATEPVSVSEQGRQLSRRYQSGAPGSEENEAQSEASGQQSPREEISYSDQLTLRKLQARDREVRAHEQAHLSAAGQYARGGASFVYQRGPDGRSYAIGGEVSIDVGKETSPEATIAKMQTVRRAALAPAQPSATDRQIAAQASVRMAQARQEQQQQRLEEMQLLSQPSQPATSASVSRAESEPAGSVNNGATSNTRRLMVEAYKAVNELL